MSCGARSIPSCCALLLVLAVGLSSAKRVGYQDDKETFQPIVSASQSKRICAALCMSGLGGRSCGSDCLDLTPSGLPVQSLNKSGDQQTSMARRDVCPILCKNRLGYPLCSCENVTDANEEVDYVQICGNLCVNFRYRLSGCQSCHVYEEAAKVHADAFAVTSSAYDRSLKSVDWEEWCRQMCSIGDGGAACNCDILPMRLEID